MERSKMIQDVLKCYEELDKIEMNGTDGWCNLATLGAKLSANGIDYKGMGYGRLKDFISSLGIFDFVADRDRQVPILYVCKKPYITSSANLQKCKSDSRTPSLFDWAYMGSYDDTMKRLKGLAILEPWSLGSKDEDKLIVLNNYLRYTFERLWDENKICYSKDKQYAAFNTGLADDRYMPIYALFKKDKQERIQEWYLVDFCFAGEELSGKTLIKLFTELPKRASYFTEISDLLYDVSKGIPTLDHHHIIIERIDRFPYSVLQNYKPKGIDIIPTENLTEKEKEEYFNNLREAMKKDKSTYRDFCEYMNSRVKLAIERIKWNYKSAIPMYNPKHKKMCLMLPLALGRDNKVQLALVVSKGENSYQGETIYLLDWAYKCARLVCRPDSDWLSTNSIQPSQKDDNE